MSCTNGLVCVCTIVYVHCMCECIYACECIQLNEGLDYLHMYYIAASTDMYIRIHNTHKQTHTHCCIIMMVKRTLLALYHSSFAL